MVRTSALGDVVHALPVVEALKGALPKAEIAWVIEAAYEPIAAAHSLVDHTIPVRTKPWRRQPFAARTRAEVGVLRRALKAFRADIALDLMGNHKGGFLSWLSGSRRRIGLSRTTRREPSSAIWCNESVEPIGVHAVERALSTLQPLGVPTTPVTLGGDHLLLDAPPETADQIAAVDEPFALIHPGAGWRNKEYPPQSWGRFAERLHRQAGIAVRVMSSPNEEALADAAIEAANGVLKAVQAPSLAGLAAWLRAAHLVVGGDTGPLHMAHAVGTPTLFVMGPTDPAQHGPFGKPEQTAFVRLPCSFCYQRLDSTKACLLNLRSEELVEHAEKLLLENATTTSPR